MKAVVFHDVGDIRIDNVPDPRIEAPTDAIIRLTASAICGTDLHMVRGSMPGMTPGTVLGHEGVGVVEEVGPGVLNLRPGDRVVVPSTIACGNCSYCRSAYYAQCDVANPHGKLAGTAFFGGPAESGPFAGLQAERARIPFAHVGPVKLPEEVSDDDAILQSDIFPTGYFGADLADVKPGRTVAVLGCGPVGIFALLSAQLLGAGRIIAIDNVPSRLETAQRLGAEVVNFDEGDVVERVRSVTGGIGVDSVIDAVGVDSNRPQSGEGPEASGAAAWKKGNAPSLALEWAVEMVAKGGTLSIIGVYPPTMKSFPLGRALNKNLSLRMGNANHRRYLPHLVELVRRGSIKPSEFLTQQQPLLSALEAYKAFDLHSPGWLKVELLPSALSTSLKLAQ